MQDSIDDLIEEKIERKLGLYDTSSARRSDNEIRDAIQDELVKRPKTSHELKNAINATKSTVENHCQHLQEIEAVTEVEIRDQKYWKLSEGGK